MTPTPLDLIRLTTEFLAGRGVDTPRLDAEVLLAHVLQVPRIQLYVQFDRPLDTVEVDAYRDLVRRRGRREPVAHLVGTREFWSLPLHVDHRVLVPRPETELLVETCLRCMPESGCLLDLGTGSGAIALALLSERDQWLAVGVDREPPALQVALDNANRTGMDKRLRLVLGDLFEPLGGDTYELIVSNPPYIPTADIRKLQPEVCAFDPHSALDGGADGLDVIRRIVADAPRHLRPHGLLAFEFGLGQRDAVYGMLKDAGAYRDIEVVDDLAHRPRVAMARTAG